MAIKSNGTLWAWGYNFYGELGDGTTISKYSPEQIGSLAPLDVTTSVVGANGSISPSSDVSSWTSDTITITPNSGYMLASLIDNGVNVTSSAIRNGSTYTYTISDVTSNQNIQATFDIQATFAPVVQSPALSTSAGFLLAAAGLGVIIWRRRKENGQTQVETR